MHGKSAGDPMGDEGGILQARFGLRWSRTKRCSMSCSVFGGDTRIFLTTVKGDRLVPVGKFLGKFIVRRAPGDTEQYVRTWHGSDDGIQYDARFLPHYKPEDRLYVPDFRTRIENRLRTGWDGKMIPGIAPERLEQLNTPQIRKQR